jgi:hypothetical protein
MKKIITLLFCIGAFATSFAQYQYPLNDKRIYRADNRQAGQYANSSFDRDNDRREHGNAGYISAEKARDYQINKINREFNERVESIQCDTYLSNHGKRKAIREAQKARLKEIAFVNERYNCAQ